MLRQASLSTHSCWTNSLWPIQFFDELMDGLHRSNGFDLLQKVPCFCVPDTANHVTVHPIVMCHWHWATHQLPFQIWRKQCSIGLKVESECLLHFGKVCLAGLPMVVFQQLDTFFHRVICVKLNPMYVSAYMRHQHCWSIILCNFKPIECDIPAEKTWHLSGGPLKRPTPLQCSLVPYYLGNLGLAKCCPVSQNVQHDTFGKIVRVLEEWLQNHLEELAPTSLQFSSYTRSECGQMHPTILSIDSTTKVHQAPVKGNQLTIIPGFESISRQNLVRVDGDPQKFMMLLQSSCHQFSNWFLRCTKMLQKKNGMDQPNFSRFVWLFGWNRFHHKQVIRQSCVTFPFYGWSTDPLWKAILFHTFQDCSQPTLRNVGSVMALCQNISLLSILCGFFHEIFTTSVMGDIPAQCQNLEQRPLCGARINPSTPSRQQPSIQKCDIPWSYCKLFTLESWCETGILAGKGHSMEV